jgi:hypothetical protein
MCSQEKQTPEIGIRARIARLSEAEEKTAKPSATEEELRVLSAVTARLDQLLARVVEAEVQELHAASSRLDQLLNDISEGKDVRAKLKRRDQRERP